MVTTITALDGFRSFQFPANAGAATGAANIRPGGPQIAAGINSRLHHRRRRRERVPAANKAAAQHTKATAVLYAGVGSDTTTVW